MKSSCKNMTFGFNIILMIFISLGSFTSCDKEVSRSPVEPEPSRGKIVISSEPEQSLIFLNGRNTGRYTPDSLSFLDDGEYSITLKRKYFKDTTLAVTILRESRAELYVDYKSNPSMYGRLALFSNPLGGSIILNDSILNLNTPDTISGLLPGEYNVRIKLSNHREAMINTIVQSSKLNSYSVVLRDTSEWIDYQVVNSEIQSNMLTCITIDNYGFKWIGTSDKGLIRFDGKNFTNYSKTN